jgi:hypothetical protein
VGWRKATTTAFWSRLSTVEAGVFGAIGMSPAKRRFVHVCTVAVLMPQRLASALTLS